MSNPNPLLSPPFYVIPGIDPNSPISAQTEQIDQLNTLLLQEIDANFARFHQIVTSRILPEIKRFAIAGEPTRETAQFWRSFFEAASAIGRTGSADDSNLPSQQETSTQYDDNTLTLRRDHHEDSSGSGMIHDESGSSFIFDPPANSTPLPSGRTGSAGGGRIHESWEDSLESPFDKLDRKLRDELKIGNGKDTGLYDLNNHSNNNNTSSDLPTPSLPSGYSLPHLGKDSSSATSSLASWNNRSTSDQQQQGYDQDSEEYSTGTVDPQDLPSQYGTTNNNNNDKNAFRPSSATPKAVRNTARSTTTTTATGNPFGSNFNGVVDLRSTPLNLNSKTSKTRRPPKQSILPGINDVDSSDEEDGMGGGLPFGMSPPVTMKFSLPPKAQAIFDVSKTPGKKPTSTTMRESNLEENFTSNNQAQTQAQAQPQRRDIAGTPGFKSNNVDNERQAKFILDDLLDEMNSELSPRIPTPEGLGRYSIMPGELQPGEGRLLFSSGSASAQSQRQETYQPSGGSFPPASASASGYNPNNQPFQRERETRRSMGANTSYGSDVVDIPVGQVYSAEDTFDMDDDEDSFDDIDDDGMMSQPTTNTGSIVGTGTGTISSVPYSIHEHIIGGNGDGNVNYDNSYLSSEGDLTTTSEAGVIFGKQPNFLPPNPHSQHQSGGLGPRKSHFELMKMDEMDTYFGGKLEDRAGHDVETSPTREKGKSSGNL